MSPVRKGRIFNIERKDRKVMSRKTISSIGIILGLVAIFGLVPKGEGEEMVVINTDLGTITVKFFEDSAPKHVESFKLHAKNGYFDGTSFHRIIPGFVIQGGDPNTRDDDRSNDGMGGHAAKFYGVGKEDDPNTWMVPAEFNDRKHERGALSMARSQDPNSAGRQFFICTDPVYRLDGKYTVFGEVVEGMDVVDKIVNSETPRKKEPRYRGPDGDNPVEPIKMTMSLKKAKE